MVEQSPDKSMQNAFLASLKASTIDTLLRHVDVDVKVTVASCITDLIWLVEIHSQLENYATQKRTPNSTPPKQNLKIIHFFSKQSKEGQQKFININHLLRKIVCLTVQKNATTISSCGSTLHMNSRNTFGTGANFPSKNIHSSLSLSISYFFPCFCFTPLRSEMYPSLFQVMHIFFVIKISDLPRC